MLILLVVFPETELPLIADGMIPHREEAKDSTERLLESLTKLEDIKSTQTNQ